MGRFIRGDLRQIVLRVFCCARPSSRLFFSTSFVFALIRSICDPADRGITGGSDVSAVRSTYGQADSVDSHADSDTLVYDKLGVAFVIDKKGALAGHVSVIFVFGQGQYHDIFRGQ
jgi:hypothetical protein